MSRSFGWTRLTTLPPMAIWPSVISSSPAIIRNSVDLPHPEGPTSTQNSPSAMPTSTPRITCVVPNHLWTPVMFTAAIAASFADPGAMPQPARVLFSWLARSVHDRIVGPSGARPRDDVLRRLASQFPLGLHRVERRVRRENDTRIADEFRVARHRLLGQHVERRAADAAGAECRDQVGDAHDRTARRVDEREAGLRRSEEVAVDHAARRRVER